ncbi:hypothetical protein DPMN_009590 [Dreissena polymorpha]|uniref:Uncharacterized protein n=1 Tax=Dreissena polymorpha TaxID=45954 RepID=A0A9D4N0K4_DREPO|nr:hypothetical protein DPMN_009590 [Dreissena polymorpha]
MQSGGTVGHLPGASSRFSVGVVRHSAAGIHGRLRQPLWQLPGAAAAQRPSRGEQLCAYVLSCIFKRTFNAHKFEIVTI